MITQRRARDRDRRQEPRAPYAQEITWRMVDQDKTCRAWVSDISRNGISFVTSASRKIQTGDLVDLQSSDQYWDRCRVIRISPYDGFLSLIACQSTL